MNVEHSHQIVMFEELHGTRNVSLVTMKLQSFVDVESNVFCTGVNKHTAKVALESFSQWRHIHRPSRGLIRPNAKRLCIVPVVETERRRWIPTTKRPDDHSGDAAPAEVQHLQELYFRNGHPDVPVFVVS